MKFLEKLTSDSGYKAGLYKKLCNEYLIGALGIFIVVLLIWVPFGVKSPDIADGWENFPYMARYDFWESIRQSITTQALTVSRPLVYLPWKLAYYIDPDSYLGVNLLAAIVFWGKAFAFYAILRKMRLVSAPQAFLMAIVFFLHPADQGTFLMSAFSRHWSVFFYLLAIFFMVLASQNPALPSFIGMGVTVAASAFISEQGFPLIVITPLILLFVNRLTKWQKLLGLFMWYLPLLTYAVRLIPVLFSEKKIYQTGLLASGVKDDSWFVETILGNLVAYRRVFIDGWVSVLGNLQWQYAKYLAIALIAGLFIGLVVYLLSRIKGEAEHPFHFWAVLGAGILIIGLGFFPYSITSYRYKDYRVFYFSAIGGALIIGMLYARLRHYLPAGYKNIASGLLWGVTIAVVLVNGFVQHRNYEIRSQFQQKVLINIVEQAPYIQGGTQIVLMVDPEMKETATRDIIDLAGFPNNMPFKHNRFTWATQWIYRKDNITAIQCQSFAKCDISFENTLIFQYTEDHGAVLLENIPGEVNKAGAELYSPYKIIRRYLPFPELPQKAFDILPSVARIAPAQWIGKDQTLNDRRVCDKSHAGQCSLVFGGGKTSTTFSSELLVEGKAGEAIELSVWARTEERIDRDTQLANLTIYYDSGETQTFILSSARLTPKWALQKAEFKTEKPYHRLLLELQSQLPQNTLWLDEVAISRNKGEIVIPNSSFEK